MRLVRCLSRATLSQRHQGANIPPFPPTGHLGLNHVPLALQAFFLIVFSVLLLVILVKGQAGLRFGPPGPALQPEGARREEQLTGIVSSWSSE